MKVPMKRVIEKALVDLKLVSQAFSTGMKRAFCRIFEDYLNIFDLSRDFGIHTDYIFV